MTLALACIALYVRVGGSLNLLGKQCLAQPSIVCLVLTSVLICFHCRGKGIVQYCPWFLRRTTTRIDRSVFSVLLDIIVVHAVFADGYIAVVFE